MIELIEMRGVDDHQEVTRPGASQVNHVAEIVVSALSGSGRLVHRTGNDCHFCLLLRARDGG